MAAAVRPALNTRAFPVSPGAVLRRLAVFAFAKDEFPDRKSLFGIPAATYMIPGQLSHVPRFVTMAEFGRCGFFRR
ncbi:hypothetical protein [Streptomyces sp. MBT65]|uniref:hypothetical protein n=1 Tax=Streptomyces sp. MBT65 TaxID=1488395 RepID=UPI001F2891E8|nr:hypothetical protein [Streptomyces sp. MBT65]